MGNGVEFVNGSFKEHGKIIEEVAARDEGFRDMCDDFLTAHDEKLQWERSSAPERDERIAEYEELIDSLRMEIAQVLERAAVVPLKLPRR
jgi:acyl-CoA reductase-like NAD-dependent aldehyde dehydrogenase